MKEQLNEETKTKKKQGPKPGKVIRVDQAAWSLLARKKRSGETVSSLIRRVLGIPPRRAGVGTGAGKTSRVFFILPESRHVLSAKTIEEARGEAIIFSIKAKKEITEKPIEVREVV